MTKNLRHYSPLDRLCLQLDKTLRQFTKPNTASQRIYPAQTLIEPELSAKERHHAAGLMRVNHAGEVAAQALYHAQGMVSRNPATSQHMQEAANEEGDHLAWCRQRLAELGSHSSYLNPLWYAGSFAIGLLAGVAGDKWSLGFVAATEQQVVQHLQTHMSLLPATDTKSKAVIMQMQADENQHREAAISSGGMLLPPLVLSIMSFTAKIMVKTAYRV
jgi:ubiquinone biosynthesis monooxygenase Coq7